MELEDRQRVEVQTEAWRKGKHKFNTLCEFIAIVAHSGVIGILLRGKRSSHLTEGQPGTPGTAASAPGMGWTGG